MKQPLTLELSAEAYASLRRQAEESGTLPSVLAAASLERQFGAGPSRGEPEEHTAPGRFERHFGAVVLGHATGAENEGIDADLAREYADPHEGA